MRFETQEGKLAVIFYFRLIASLPTLDEGRISILIRRAMQNFPYASNDGWENSPVWIESSRLEAAGKSLKIQLDGAVVGLLSPDLELQVSVKFDEALILDKISCVAAEWNEPKQPDGLSKSLPTRTLMVAVTMIAGVVLTYIFLSRSGRLPDAASQTNTELEEVRQQMERMRQQESEAREQLERQKQELLRQQQASEQLLRGAQARHQQAELAISRQHQEAEATQPTNTQEFADSDLRQFITTFLTAFNSGEVSRLLNLYTGRVDYFNKGVVGKDFIKRDKNYYFKRWPQQINDLEQVISIGREGNVYILDFAINFQVYNYSRKEKIYGKAESTLTVVGSDGGLKISGEKQTILERHKESLP